MMKLIALSDKFKHYTNLVAKTFVMFYIILVEYYMFIMHVVSQREVNYRKFVSPASSTLK